MGLIEKVVGILKSPDRNVSLGRNESCWCGSGKKYKHCHLDRDRRRLQSSGRNCSTAS
jgi:uncharacterized protein YecA (UPF0149 family)